MATRKTTSSPTKRATKGATKTVRKSPARASRVKPAPVPAGDVPVWLSVARAAENKKAIDIRVLDLREVASFADYFIVCSGSNPRQVQAISEEIDRELAKRGEHPNSVEGFSNAEWILADYGDFVVHVFSEKAREFYGLERLWKGARELPVPPAHPHA